MINTLAIANLGSASSIICFIVGVRNTLLEQPLSLTHEYWPSLSRDQRVWLVRLHANYSASSLGAYIYWQCFMIFEMTRQGT